MTEEQFIAMKVASALTGQPIPVNEETIRWATVFQKTQIVHFHPRPSARETSVEIHIAHKAGEVFYISPAPDILEYALSVFDSVNQTHFFLTRSNAHLWNVIE